MNKTIFSLVCCLAESLSCQCVCRMCWLVGGISISWNLSVSMTNVALASISHLSNLENRCNQYHNTILLWSAVLKSVKHGQCLKGSITHLSINLGRAKCCEGIWRHCASEERRERGSWHHCGYNHNTSHSLIKSFQFYFRLPLKYYFSDLANFLILFSFMQSFCVRLEMTLWSSFVITLLAGEF